MNGTVSKIARILTAVAILAAITGAEGSGCDVQSNRREQDRQVNPDEKRDVTITANSSGPYTILVIATDNAGGIERTGPRHVAGGEYKQTLSYETGTRIEVKVSVRGHRDDIMACSIADGSHVERLRAAGEVVCLLTTSR